MELLKNSSILLYYYIIMTEEQKGFIRWILEEINDKRFNYCIICESEEERNQESSELSLESLIYTAQEVYNEWIDKDDTEDDFLFWQYYSLKELNLI